MNRNRNFIIKRDAEEANKPNTSGLDIKRVYTMVRDADKVNSDMIGESISAERTEFYNKIVKRDSLMTQDISAVVPVEIMETIIKKMNDYGQLFADITKTRFKGGVVIPVEAVKPTASWVAEGAGSTPQKGEFNKIVFAYHKLRCEVRLSQEVSQMTVSTFENYFSDVVAEAMVIAIEKSIIAGTGSGQPTGIINGMQVSGNDVKTADGISAGTKYTNLDYATLVKAELSLKGTNRANAKWYFTSEGFGDVLNLVDNTGRPIVISTLDANGKIRYNILGREVKVIDDAFDGAEISSTPVTAILFNPKDYALNIIYDLGVKKQEDWDNEDIKIKAVMSVDGMMVRPVGEARMHVLIKGA